MITSFLVVHRSFDLIKIKKHTCIQCVLYDTLEYCYVFWATNIDQELYASTLWI